MNNQLCQSVLKMNRSLTTLRRRAHWPQEWGRGRRLLATVALALCLAVPGLAIVQGTFSDVPPSAFYYNAVEAIYRAGITLGCNAGMYCPDQAVTRAQMAAFLHRGLPRVAYNEGPGFYGLRRYETTQLAVVTINTGGAPGQTGFVKLDGAVTILGSSCDVGFNIARDGGGDGQPQTITVYNGYANGAMSWVVAVPTGTTQTFRLGAYISSGNDFAANAYGHLSAIYVPFGSTGTNTLAAQPADEQLPAAPQSDRPELPTLELPELPMKRKGQ